MIDNKSLNDLAAKIASLLPSDLDTLKKDLEKNIRAGLQSGLQKLDLVSREEFDVQSAVLARTREKLETLEKRVRALEGPETGKQPDKPVDNP
ncbi:MAG TPA: accessory factor UbiK family protein [Gammaproteobacteria bacterium]